MKNETPTLRELIRYFAQRATTELPGFSERFAPVEYYVPDDAPALPSTLYSDIGVVVGERWLVAGHSEKERLAHFVRDAFQSPHVDSGMALSFFENLPSEMVSKEIAAYDSSRRIADLSDEYYRFEERMGRRPPSNPDSERH